MPTTYCSRCKLTALGDDGACPSCAAADAVLEKDLAHDAAVPREHKTGAVVPYKGGEMGHTHGDPVEAKADAALVERLGCPKCGGTFGPPKFCSIVDLSCRHHVQDVPFEHLYRTCQTCEYVRVEPTKDAKPQP